MGQVCYLPTNNWQVTILPHFGPGMAFVNLSLLLGGALIAIPVVLHLIMRQKPKQLVFPAVRFIQQRRIANQRRLQGDRPGGAGTGAS
jgi:hypothetical protein